MILNKENGLLFKIQDHILKNSWVKQPELALGAALGLMSAVIDRKYVFMGNCANLYLLNIGRSGSGKDAPQQAVKNILLETGLKNRMGAGDYVSDASLMDGLESQPIRIDVIDEAAGFLNSATKAGSTYSMKIPDILCELYTSSNSYYPGRMLAGGVHKGQCTRPYVSLLMSTTPQGFKEAVNISSLEKGLMGRCLLFFAENKSGKLPTEVDLCPILKQDIMHLANKVPLPDHEGVSTAFFGIDSSHSHHFFKAETESREYLSSIYKRYEDVRIAMDDEDLMMPIQARAFQMVCKIALIHSLSRDVTQQPVNISKLDLDFAAKVVDNNLNNFSLAINNYADVGFEFKAFRKIEKFIEKKEVVTMQQLRNSLRSFDSRTRINILNQLMQEGKVKMDIDYDENQQAKEVYRWIS